MSPSAARPFATDRVIMTAAVALFMAMVILGVLAAARQSVRKASLEEIAAAQVEANNEFHLNYVDAQKALFRTPRGLSLVMVGSSLEPAGHVISIEVVEGHWTITTDKGVQFVKQ